MYGNRADDGDQRHRGSDGLRLAVAGGDEIGDRRDVLRLGEPHDAHDERRAEPDHQDRPDIDRQKVETRARGEPDRAEERPGRAVDREREGIDEQPRAASAAEPPRPVAVARDHEQKADIAERKGDNDPALQHDGSVALRGATPVTRSFYRTKVTRREYRRKLPLRVQSPAQKAPCRSERRSGHSIRLSGAAVYIKDGDRPRVEPTLGLCGVRHLTRARRSAALITAESGQRDALARATRTSGTDRCRLSFPHNAISCRLQRRCSLRRWAAWASSRSASPAD